MNLIPELAVDDGLVLAGVGRALVHGFADVDPVVQDPVEDALVEQLAVLGGSRADQLPCEQGGRFSWTNRSKIDPDPFGLFLVDDQLSVLDLVAERRPAAHPHALLAGGRDFVADALADHLALKLGEGQQDIERQPTHRARRVERLGHGDEGDAVALEHLDQLGEVHH